MSLVYYVVKGIKKHKGEQQSKNEFWSQKSQLSISSSTSLMKLLNLSESQLPLSKMKATIASHRVVPVKSKMHQEHLAQSSVVDSVGDTAALHSENISPTYNFPTANTCISFLCDFSCCWTRFADQEVGPTCQRMNSPQGTALNQCLMVTMYITQ